MALVDAYTYEIDCNWKLAFENLADTYHVDVIPSGNVSAATRSIRIVRSAIWS